MAASDASVVRVAQTPGAGATVVVHEARDATLRARAAALWTVAVFVAASEAFALGEVAARARGTVRGGQTADALAARDVTESAGGAGSARATRSDAAARGADRADDGAVEVRRAAHALVSRTRLAGAAIRRIAAAGLVCSGSRERPGEPMASEQI